MALEQEDVVQIERVVNKGNDDVAIATARSFERLEECVNSMEARIQILLYDVQEKVVECRQEIAHELDGFKADVRATERS